MAGEEEEDKTTSTAETPVDDKAPATEPAKATADAQTAAEAAKTKEPAKTPWYERRIGVLTAKNADLEAAKQQVERELAVAKAALAQGVDPQKQQQTGTGGLTQAEINARIQAEADRIATSKKFDEDCNTIYEAGVKDFPDFQSRVVGNFAKVGGLQPSLIEAAQQTGMAHKVLYELGGNLDEASRIMALPPVRQAVEITKLAAKLSQPAAISKAPDPINPLSSATAKTEEDPEKMDMPTWVKWRDQQIEARRKRA